MATGRCRTPPVTPTRSSGCPCTPTFPPTKWTGSATALSNISNERRDRQSGTGMILVTGGAGFIGSAFVRTWLDSEAKRGGVVNLDLLTYAGNIRNLAGLGPAQGHRFERGDIGDRG